MEPVTVIRNIGPATAAAFARIGIKTAEALREMGADAAYAALLRAGERPHFIGYYVLVMGLQGRPWSDCQGLEKDALRARFDAIKAAHAGAAQAGASVPTGIEAILNEIGVIPTPAVRR